ncbi:MAG: ATP synthase subunit delta [Candidatus Woesebacteria bacterium GW2011_GWD1_38_10]|uniref:ATP synthase subunit delta n=2 Tax=Candidatus Woeseibacteriota TaxID=1752722 RepID=A0A0G0KVG4_9BACT|nr:MAG: ATP synthase subunit delta [Candidatus Woesebacteria bacterium GW2011_GWD1_38_10]KKQ76405.1 MAG: ATP synthase subunit delta [Microgenomates group bacterium GW2011_GWF1_38_5]KKQ82777.1 MAG: ATP synthase subunit delta [Candidatus Woesebacteria bacterium GW2011_GWA1_38_8]
MDENKVAPTIIGVVSSVETNEEQRRKIKDKALQIFDLKSADFRFSVDKTLIGGFVLLYKSMVLDLSIKRKLSEMV